MAEVFRVYDMNPPTKPGREPLEKIFETASVREFYRHVVHEGATHKRFYDRYTLALEDTEDEGVIRHLKVDTKGRLREVDPDTDRPIGEALLDPNA